MHPCEIAERVRCDFVITNAEPLLRQRVRHLVKIAPRRAHEPQFIHRAPSINQVRKSGEARGLIVQDCGFDAFESSIRTASSEASVVCKSIRVAAKVKVLVSLMIISISRLEFSKPVCFEAVSSDDVEDTIAAITIV